ncbi:CopG family antitoxin [Carboxydochorda subterranea]|uniref:CopG family antitoxin n=1 Tax=Carboxydichorda subterranea TaxID=3109565 RepID=A0ABZ1C1Y6_9FIRM|nr:CopG family antitoxin [Limnochorda sp. L945t]WRP18860.1 CopG family antitoxin [Limnochorda sp. L945t]
MKRKMKEISDPKDIPAFASEQEEADLWATHSLSPGVLERMQPIPPGELPAPRPRTKPVAIRFDPDVLERLQALAKKKARVTKHCSRSSCLSGSTRRRSEKAS